MKKFFLFTNLLFLCLVVGFSAQAKDVGGIIDEDTVWTTVDSPIVVIEDVTVIEGVTLTVEPNVEVKFEPDKTLIIDGTLVARGTSNDKIIFTSNTGTEPGSWGYISFTDTSTDATFDPDGNYTGGCIIQHAIVEYGGSGSSVITINACSPFLDNSTIENNTGSGISVTASVSLISNCKIRINSGGGISLGTGGNTTIKNCDISDNPSSRGIYAKDCTILIQDGTVISGHSVSVSGGGIYANSCTVIIQNSTISGNSSSYNYDSPRYGAGIYAPSSTVLIQDSTISENSVYSWYGGYGGGIYATSSSVVTIQNSKISGNSASHYGGGVYAPSNIVLQDSEIIGNSTSGDGGGIYAQNPTVTIKNSVVSGNSAGGDGGGICASASTVAIQDNSTLESNTAKTNGGGICAKDKTVIIVQNSVLTVNSANTGGGIWSNYQAAIKANTFKDNSAVQKGGAIYASGTMEIKNNTLTKGTSFGNTAPFGAAIYASGTVTLQKNIITQNMAPAPFGCVLRLVDIDSDSVIGGSEENANVIKDNIGDGVYFKGDAAFNYNELHDNSWYEFVSGNPSGSDIDANHNDWGTTDEDKIRRRFGTVRMMTLWGVLSTKVIQGPQPQ